MKEQKLRELIEQKVCELGSIAEHKMFCRDCQRAVIDLLQKYRALETANNSVLLLLDEARQEAKGWEKVYTDLTLIVNEYKELLKTLSEENVFSAQIIEEWEERRREEVLIIDD